jgi:hypothetical protein
LKKNRDYLSYSKSVFIFAPHLSPDGGIGRRAGLKHQWINLHAGSIPALGTRKKAKYLIIQYLAFSFA